MQTTANSSHSVPIRFVGCFDSRVTLYSQQVRSLNLIHDLLVAGEIPTDGRIAVVGAGAAGITVASALALARPETQVDVFETETQILHFQYNACAPYLRPHIYDWPEEGASNDDAGLPILNWTASSAATVAETIKTQFAQLNRGTIQLHLGTYVSKAELAWHCRAHNQDINHRPKAIIPLCLRLYRIWP